MPQPPLRINPRRLGIIRRTDDDYGWPTIMDPQGNPRASSAIGNVFMFQGRPYDPETGFYWYRTRYYDPRAGRFTSRDTIGIWGDPLNLGNGYTFVGNNPWTLLDPFGLDAIGDDVDRWIKRESTPVRVRDAARNIQNSAQQAAGAVAGGFVQATGGRYVKAIDDKATRDTIVKWADRVGLACDIATVPGKKYAATKALGAVLHPVQTARRIGSGLSTAHAACSSAYRWVGRRLAGNGDDLARAAAGGTDNAVEAAARSADDVAEVAARSGKPSNVWTKPPTERGKDIEKYLAENDYRDWYNIGQDQNGMFDLVDFQKGDNLLSLKSVDTTGTTWMERMQNHIIDLGSRGATVNDKPARMILDLRVQPGGLNAAKPLVDFGTKNNVTVIIKEFP